MKKTTYIAAFIALVFTGLFSAASFADIAVIIHPSNTSKINVKDVKRIFLDQRRTFPGGGKVTPADQEDDKIIRRIFIKKVLKKSPRELQAYWSKQMFSGQGTPPKQLPDDDSVKEFVAQNESGIGYIDQKNVDNSVKVAFTFR